MKKALLYLVAVMLPLAGWSDDDLDKLLDKLGKKKGSGEVPPDVLKQRREAIAKRALSRVKLVESPALKAIRQREPEPGPGRLIYRDDFESYKPGDHPKHWPAKTCHVVKVNTPENRSQVMKFAPVKPYDTHAYMDPKIFATNFRLKFDFLCGESGEVTWLTRLHGERGHSLWSNENYYQTGFYTTEGRPLSFGARHLWTGGGHPFVNAPQPAVTLPQPSHQLAWHSAEIVMDDDRFILKLNGVRVLDGHYPVLMARTRKGLKYGFGLVARDAYSSTPKAPWVYNEWYDNIEIYDLGTPIRERRWPRRWHVAPWGDDANSGADPAHPWRTLAKAFSQMRRGDQLTLQAGEYAGDVSWQKPAAADLPRADATLADFPTVIRATPHEQVTLTGHWNLANAGHVSLERLQFTGKNSSLTMESARQSEVALKRLQFGNQSAGLKITARDQAKILAGRSLFLGAPVKTKTTADAQVTFARSVFTQTPTGGSYLHCTFTTPAPAGKLVNCLSLRSLEAAGKVLHDPANGRFDPKGEAEFIDTGKVLKVKLPAWADMPTAGRLDLGAFEYFPPAEVVVNFPPLTKDILTGKPVMTPVKERAEILRTAIARLRPGVTLRVGDGLWTEGDLALGGLRGEPYAPIRIESAQPLGAVIHGGVRFTNCDWLHLGGFRIAGWQGTKPFKVSEGLTWSGCGRTFVERCEITAFGHAGVSGEEQGVTLRQNWIHHNGTGGLNHGIYWSGEGPSWVVGNTFYGNAGWAFHNHQGAYDGWRGWKHNVHHNLFIGPGGAVVTTGSRGRFFHNTIIRASNAAFWFYNDGHRDNRIANNLIVDSTNSIHTRDGNTFTHNLTFNKTKTLLGDHALTADPRFVDPTKHDYRLQPNSPARNAGKPVGLSINPRPTIGAYDGTPAWAPPKPLPKYVPEALRGKKDAPKLPGIKID